MGAIVGAKCILPKIRGCHGTPGTHANTPSAVLSNPYYFSLNRVPTRMEFGECIYDFDIIDVAERSPLNYLDEQNRRFSEEQGC